MSLLYLYPSLRKIKEKHKRIYIILHISFLVIPHLKIHNFVYKKSTKGFEIFLYVQGGKMLIYTL